MSTADDKKVTSGHSKIWATLALRLRWLRKNQNLSLEALGQRLGVTRSYLSRLERGKSENPSTPLVSMICQTYALRTDWLLHGQGQPFEAEFLNRAAESGESPCGKIPGPLTIHEKTKELGLFIAALMMAGGHASAEFLMKTLCRVLSNPLALPEVTIEAARLIADQLDLCLRTKPVMSRPPPEVRNLQSVLAKGRIAGDSYARLIEDALGSVEVGWVEKRLLTHVHESVKHDPVKSQMANLLALLNSATRERGKKSELAAHLKVPLASISQWLSGVREPGGETTLRLLDWVQAEEAKPKSPGGVEPPPEPKTQVRKFGYEKQTQVRKNQ